jgi:phosphatidylglycerophosphate synthase
VLAAGALLAAGREPDDRATLLVLAVLGMQGRLLCNLLDGMLAIEGGLRTRSGELFNELPDRLSDLLILAAAGYAIPWLGWAAPLGWLAAALALLTAYVRALGGAVGAGQDYGGPMAKQQRMALLSAGCLLAAGEGLAGWPGWSLLGVLALVALGSALTVLLRVRRLRLRLELGGTQ